MGSSFGGSLHLKHTNMNFIEAREVKVGPNTFKVKLTNRAMIEFENLSGTTVSDFKGTEQLIQFFYCTAKAGDKEFKYTYDEFLDVVDEYYLDVVTNFTKAMASEETESEKK